MLTKVEVRTATGGLLVLPMDDISAGYAIRDIGGLDPVKATLVSSSFANLDGAQYHSSRREPRNIRITLDLEPDYITTFVQDLRKNLYAFFMPKSQVELRFYVDDDFVANISGRVESFETPLFTREPQVVISLMCYDPDFIELETTTVEGDTVDDSTEFLITYNGSVETGIKFVLEVDRELTEFTIYHRPADDQVRTLEFAASLMENDILTITTTPGSKSVILNRSSSLSSLLYGMSPQSNWIELLPGDNYFRVFAEGDPVPFSIEYATRHGGL